MESVMKKRKPLLWLIIAAIAVIVIIVVVVTSRPSVKLQYAWGTALSEVNSNEKDTQYWNLTTCYYIYSYQHGHIVDGLDEFSIESNGSGEVVCFEFDADQALYEVHYQYSEPVILTKALDLLIDHYGRNYFEDGNYYYWWIGDTIVQWRADIKEITYCSAAYAQAHSMYSDAATYFGK